MGLLPQDFIPEVQAERFAFFEFHIFFQSHNYSEHNPLFCLHVGLFNISCSFFLQLPVCTYAFGNTKMDLIYTGLVEHLIKFLRSFLLICHLNKNKPTVT